jgi:sRNA-binding protein
MDDWMFHHRVVMRTLGIYAAFKEDRPAQDAAKLRGFLGADPAAASRPQLAKAKAHLVAVRKRQRVWDHHNDRAYADLVVACDSQQSPMEVVYAHAEAVAALPQGAPGAGQDPTAARLLADLAARFSQAKNIGVVQAAIAEFHSLALVPNERLESFINRLTAAMRRLHALGQTDVDLNVYCLGRLKESHCCCRSNTFASVLLQHYYTGGTQSAGAWIQ